MYAAFIKHRKSPQWCAQRCIDYKAMNRACIVKNQLKNFLQRNNVPIVSGGADTIAIRKCLVSGYFAHAARLLPDGSYKSIVGNMVFIILNYLLINRSC